MDSNFILCRRRSVRNSRIPVPCSTMVRYCSSPVSSLAQFASLPSNILRLCLADDVYYDESICVHEHSHTLQGSGGKLESSRQIKIGSSVLDLDDVLRGIHQEDVESGSVWSNTYAATNHEEMWAEAVQSYYSVNREGPQGGDGVHNQVWSRNLLESYHSDLHDVIGAVFPSDAEFSCPTTSLGNCDCTRIREMCELVGVFVPGDPTSSPTRQPTPPPTPQPTPSPTPGPTPQSTPSPTPGPTPDPTPLPTPQPTPGPTLPPTPQPTPTPSPQPTPSPTLQPTPFATPGQTPPPTTLPQTSQPTFAPTLQPVTALPTTPPPTLLPTPGSTPMPTTPPPIVTPPPTTTPSTLASVPPTETQTETTTSDASSPLSSPMCYYGMSMGFLFVWLL